MNETQTPNGGWQWYQPQTKFRLDRQSKPSSVSITLDQAAELVQAMRLKNPQFNLPDGFYQIRTEILNYNRQRLGLPPSDAPPKSTPQQPKRAAAVVDHAAKTAAGIKLIAQWLGSGLKPVTKQLATARAATCTSLGVGGALCPKNQKVDMWQQLDAIAAREMRQLIGKKNELKLETEFDGQLNTCVACDCWLQLKIWSPLNHILSNTSEEVKASLPAGCWVLKEIP